MDDFKSLNIIDDSNLFITATTSVVVISDDPIRPSSREIQELWIPAPYNMCLNLHCDSLNILPNQTKIRGRRKLSKQVQVLRSFADECQKYLTSQNIIKDQLYIVLEQERPKIWECPHLERCEKVYKQYVKDHPNKIKFGKYVTVIDGENIVRIYNNYQDAMEEADRIAPGQNLLCTEHEKDPNEDSDDDPMDV